MRLANDAGPDDEQKERGVWGDMLHLLQSPDVQRAGGSVRAQKEGDCTSGWRTVLSCRGCKRT